MSDLIYLVGGGIIMLVFGCMVIGMYELAEWIAYLLRGDRDS